MRDDRGMENGVFKNIGQAAQAALQSYWANEKTARGFDPTDGEVEPQGVGRPSGAVDLPSDGTTTDTNNVIPFPAFTGVGIQHHVGRFTTGCGGISGERTNASARAVSNRSPDDAGYPPAGIAGAANATAPNALTTHGGTRDKIEFDGPGLIPAALHIDMPADTREMLRTSLAFTLNAVIGFGDIVEGVAVSACRSVSFHAAVETLNVCAARPGGGFSPDEPRARDVGEHPGAICETV